MDTPTQNLSVFDLLLSVTKRLISFYLDEAYRIKDGKSDLSTRHIQVYANSLTILKNQWQLLGQGQELQRELNNQPKKRKDYERWLKVLDELQKCFMESVIERIENCDEEDILQRIVDQNTWTNLNAEA